MVRFTASAVPMMFSPERLTMSRVTTALPSRRAKLSRSWKPKSTRATSRTYTGRPLVAVTTTSSSRRVSRNSPSTRTRYFWFPTSIAPPGMVTFSLEMALTTSVKLTP
jgi:hypothetical protein